MTTDADQFAAMDDLAEFGYEHAAELAELDARARSVNQARRCGAFTASGERKPS